MNSKKTGLPLSVSAAAPCDVRQGGFFSEKSGKFLRPNFRASGIAGVFFGYKRSIVA
jgi:hypothetical protein